MWCTLNKDFRLCDMIILYLLFVLNSSPKNSPSPTVSTSLTTSSLPPEVSSAMFDEFSSLAAASAQVL